MKRLMFAVMLSLVACLAYADTNAVKEVVAQAATNTTKDAAKLDARVEDALKITKDRLANMSQEEKEKLVDDLNHPDGKTIGQGMALFGKEIGQGLGGAVKEVGSTFNEFANSGVGKITIFIIFWKFFGHSILWFILIAFMLKGLGKFLKNVFGEYTPEGKFIRLNIANTSKLDDGVVFGMWLLVAFVLVACIAGAAVNF